MAILSTGNNGWKIPSGITVGSRLKDAIDLYGEVSPGKGSRGIRYAWYSESKINRYALEVEIEYTTNVKINGPKSKIVSLQVSTGGATSIERDEEF